MERNYWLLRKRRHLACARDAATSEIKLIHLDLAGRYSIKAAAAGDAETARSPAARPATAAQAGSAPTRYDHLEIGARWLASHAQSAGERDEHLGMANRYARLHLESYPSRRR